MASAERQRFSTCLRAFVDEKIEARLGGDAFDTRYRAQPAPRRRRRTAPLTSLPAVRAGDTRTAAERDAGLEVDDLRENYKGLFHAATEPSQSARAQ